MSSSIKMFTDDTKVYREITDFENDTRALQTYIVRLANWATLRQRRFNQEKCETMRILNSQPWQVEPLLTRIKNYACQVYERFRSPCLLWFIVERPIVYHAVVRKPQIESWVSFTELLDPQM